MKKIKNNLHFMKDNMNDIFSSKLAFVLNSFKHPENWQYVIKALRRHITYNIYLQCINNHSIYTNSEHYQSSPQIISKLAGNYKL